MPQHPKLETARDGSLLLNFGQYGEEVEVAAISGDGRRVLTVREVDTAEVWDAASGDRVGVIVADSPLRATQGTAPVAGEFSVFIESAALNGDGSLALLGLNDGTAAVFTSDDGVQRATLHPPHEEPASKWSVIRSVAFSPDGSLALVGFAGRAVGVWSQDGARAVAFLEAAAGARLVANPFVRDTLVSSVAASFDNRRVFAGCADGTAFVWDLPTHEVLLEALEHAEGTLALFDDDDGFGWATTGGSVWRVHDAQVTRSFAAREHWAEARFVDGGLLTRGFDGAIARWDFTGGREALFAPLTRPDGYWSDRAETLANHEGAVLFPESGKRLVVARGAQRVAIERDAQIVSARFCPRGDRVAVDGWKNELELWSLDGRRLRSFASPGGVGDFAFSSDGARVAVGEIGKGGGDYPRAVFVYDVETGRELHRVQEHDWQVSCVLFSPDGRVLASVGEDLVLWSLDEANVIARLEVDRSSAGLSFLRDGRLVVVDKERVRVFRGARELVRFRAPIGFRTRWCIGTDERAFTVSVAQGVARYDLATGAELGVWRAPVPRPERLFSSELTRALGIRVGAARWNVEGAAFLHHGDGPRGFVEPLYLSPDGVVAAPADGGAVIVDARSQELLAVVPFEGKLRASRIVGGDEGALRAVVLVNETGCVFRAPLPPRSVR